MKSEYWWYKTNLLTLKQYKPKLADGMNKLWDRQDTPLITRNTRLVELIQIFERQRVSANSFFKV